MSASFNLFFIIHKQYSIGLDVHKDTIAYTHSQSRVEATYHGTCGSSNLTIERKLRKLAKELGVAFQELHVCYEAGSTGFVLGRHLIGLEWGVQKSCTNAGSIIKDSSIHRMLIDDSLRVSSIRLRKATLGQLRK